MRGLKECPSLWTDFTRNVKKTKKKKKKKIDVMTSRLHNNEEAAAHMSVVVASFFCGTHLFVQQRVRFCGLKVRCWRFRLLFSRVGVHF